MEIIKKYITNNPCYQQGRTIVPKGIIVHSIGKAQPNPDVIFNNFNKSTAKSAVHGIVGKNAVYQIMPWNYRAWGCGSGNKGSGNDSYIQFEICEPAGHTYGSGSTMIGYDSKKQQSYFDSVWAKSVNLAAYLCEVYKLSPNTIICHSEAFKKGIASNHGDVMHWFPKHGKSMDDFRKAVADKLNYVPPAPVDRNSSKEDIEWLQNKLNKANKDYQIPITGVFDQKTRISLLMFADTKGWNWDNTWGFTARQATINSLAKVK